MGFFSSSQGIDWDTIERAVENMHFAYKAGAQKAQILGALRDHRRHGKVSGRKLNKVLQRFRRNSDDEISRREVKRLIKELMGEIEDTEEDDADDDAEE